jgi:phage gpG-like protein
MMDIQKFREDFYRKASQMESLKKKILHLIAGAAEKMKDANFSAQGFVVNGAAHPKWKKRKKETSRSKGKRILSGTGYLQENVKAKALKDHVRVGVDLDKVPYAKIHNEGGEITQHVQVHTRRNKKTGKAFSVKAHDRHLNMPQRKFLGYSSDIEKIALKEIDFEIKKIFK